MALQHPKGTFDILPDADGLYNIGPWQELESRVREILARHGFSELRTPIYESTELYRRGVGETTDIVEKEMYCFGGDDHQRFALRPEQTAGVVRAYLQHNLHKSQPRQKWFYIGPNFRHERPQKGRFRQHHQIGVEQFGSKSAKADAENVAILMEIYKAAGLQNLEMVINTLGDRNCRPAYRDALHECLLPIKDELCGQCHNRFERNIFRVLDCKNKDCAKLTAGVPRIDEYLNEECHRDYEEWKSLLTGLSVPFRENPRLVRGLDYYSKSVYECMSTDLGAQSSLGGGGRYDALLCDLGGNAADVGATGFGTGIERILLAQEAANKGHLDRPAVKPDVYFVVIPCENEHEIRQACFDSMFKLRDNGIYADMEYDARSVKAQMRVANKRAAQFAVIIGPDEYAKGLANLKCLADSSEQLVAFGDLTEHILKFMKQ